MNTKFIKILKFVSFACGLILVLVLTSPTFNGHKATAGESGSERAINMTKVGLRSYITQKNQLLDSLALQDSAKAEKSRIVFSQYLPGIEIKDLVKKYNLQVNELYIGWGDHQGGFTAQKGLSIDEIISDASKAHKEFLQAVISTEKNKELLASLKEYDKAFQDNGLTIFGIDAEASVGVLEQMKDENQIVRLLDIDDQNKDQFLVPISPFDFNNLK